KNIVKFVPLWIQGQKTFIEISNKKLISRRQKYSLQHLMPLFNLQCTPYFHHLCYMSHVKGVEPIAVLDTFPISVLLLRNFRKPEKKPILIEQMNPIPLVRQSHLQPLDQRSSPIF
ncbi:hypothetical protein SFRURICE_014072, partial [Spodoptera frugiperda]